MIERSHEPIHSKKRLLRVSPSRNSLDPKMSKRFMKPVFLFGLKKQDIQRCFDALEMCGLDKLHRTDEVYFSNFGDFINIDQFRDHDIFARGGLVLLKMPDYFAQDPVFWLAFNLATLAKFPQLAVIPIIPESPSESVVSFARFCPAQLSFKSSAEEYFAVISAFRHSERLNCKQ